MRELGAPVSSSITVPRETRLQGRIASTGSRDQHPEAGEIGVRRIRSRERRPRQQQHAARRRAQQPAGLLTGPPIDSNGTPTGEPSARVTLRMRM